jgi:hypothetical protein
MQNKITFFVIVAVLIAVSLYASNPPTPIPTPKATPTSFVLGDRPVKWIDDPNTGEIILNPVCRGVGVYCDDVYYSVKFKSYWRLHETPIVPTVTPMGTQLPTKTPTPIATPRRCFLRWCW